MALFFFFFFNLQLSFISQKWYSPVFLIFPARESSNVNILVQQSGWWIPLKWIKEASHPPPPSQPFTVSSRALSPRWKDSSPPLTFGVEWIKILPHWSPAHGILGGSWSLRTSLFLILKMGIIIATHEHGCAPDGIRSRWGMWTIQA